MRQPLCRSGWFGMTVAACGSTLPLPRPSSTPSRSLSHHLVKRCCLIPQQCLALQRPALAVGQIRLGRPRNLPVPQPLEHPLVLLCPRRHLSSRSEEHTSELQSRENLVCRLLLEKKKQATY